jgi:carboxylesterase type B
MVGADQQAMRAQMMDYWGAFARQGAAEPAQAAGWPAYHGNPAPHAMVLSLEPADNSHPEAASQISADHNCGFWAGISEN